MKAPVSDSLTYPRLFPRIIITILTLVIFSVAPSILAQSGREQIEGVQSWSKDRVWAEQRSYGFGAPEERPELYAYVYGSRADRGSSSARSAYNDKDQDRSRE